MCSSEVEREIKTTTMTFILCMCCCHLPSAVWQRQAMCSSQVGREIKDNNDDLCVCCCHLLSAVWQRQAMCSSEVEREIKTTTMTFIYVCAVVTYLLQCDRDRQCVAVKWRGR